MCIEQYEGILWRGRNTRHEAEVDYPYKLIVDLCYGHFQTTENENILKFFGESFALMATINYSPFYSLVVTHNVADSRSFNGVVPNHVEQLLCHLN